MRVIIAGSRTISDAFLVHRAILESGFEITEVVTGCCKGVDRLGESYARNNLLRIKYFPADWEQFGPGAGPIRNKLMADYADALILVWDGKSKGSANMLRNAREHNLLVYEKIVQQDTAEMPSLFDDLRKIVEDVHENTQPTQEPLFAGF